MSELKKTLIEKQETITNKQKELDLLVSSFLNNIQNNSTEFILNFIQVVNKTNISLKFENFKSIYINIPLNTEDKTYSVSYHFEEQTFNEETINQFLMVMPTFINNINNINNNDLFDFIKDYNKLYASIKRLINQKDLLLEDLSKEEDSKYINALKSYLCSEKNIINEDKKNFIKEESLSKDLVFFKILNFSTKKIKFEQGKLLVKIQSGKRRFEWNGSLISKRDAIEILENQIFVDKKQITKFEQVPLYKAPNNNYQSSYSRFRKNWTQDLEEYISNIKSLLIQLKFVDF